MIQIISMRSPTRTTEGMTEFIREVQKIMEENNNKLLAMSITSLDMFGYITYLIKVEKDEDIVGREIAHQLEPCKWTTMVEPLDGFVWKAVNEQDVPLFL